jgi:hypothetical protein
MPLKKSLESAKRYTPIGFKIQRWSVETAECASQTKRRKRAKEAAARALKQLIRSH